MRRQVPIHKILSLIRVLLAIISTEIFIGCTPDQESHYQPNEKVSIASRVRLDVAKKLRDEMGLTPIGVGGGMMNQIELLSLTFQCHNSLNMEEGRRILVRATELFLKEVNAHEQIRPYLKNDPFEPNNVEVVIFLQNSDYSKVKEGEICVLASREGKLQYRFEGPDHNHYLKTVEEKYEEGKRIVELENEKADSHS